MTNSESGSAWQPPSEGAPPPPAPPRLPDRPVLPSGPPQAQLPPTFDTTPGLASGAPGEMSFGVETPEPSTKRRSKIGIGGAVVGVLALGAAGVFAAAQIGGGNDGGADSPEAVGLAMMESLEQEDVIGLIDLLLPGERETFREPMIDLVSELSRLEVLSADASLADLAGIDIEFSNEAVVVAGTNVDDISNITMTANGTATIDGEQLPIGDFITDTVREVSGDDMDLTDMDDVSDADLDVSMAVVEQDGRWFLSLFHTVAEEARKQIEGDIPDAPVAVKGGDSPEGAIDVLLDGVEQLDVAKIIGAMNPNEAQALQRYAPIFLDEANAELESVPLSWQVTNTEYSVEGDGSKRFVTVTSLRVDGDIEGEAFSLELADGCVVATTGDDRFASCETEADTIDLDEIFSDAQPLQDLIAQVEATFADYEAPGITVHEVDGQWFVSPIGAAFDQVLAVLGALDRDELDGLVDQVERTIEFAADEFGELADEFLGGDVTFDEGTFDEGTFDAPSSDEEYQEWDRARQACYDLGDPTAAAQCVQDHIADGTLPGFYLPIELEFVECGLGGISTGQVAQFEQSDEEYIEMTTVAGECFARLIASGEVNEFDVPAEYLRVECAEGQNPWSFDNDDTLFDRWIDCIYE